jgi:hypothetical protein
VSEPGVTDRIDDLVRAALGKAFRWLEDSESLMSFLVVESAVVPCMPLDVDLDAPEGGPALPPPGTLRRGLVPVLSDELGPLREFVVEHRADLEAYAIVFDARLRSPDTGEAEDAVCVETAEAGATTGLVVAAPYRRSAGSGPPVPVGQMYVIERPPSLLRAE